MVKSKFNNASKSRTVPDKDVPANGKNRKKWSWNWLYKTLYLGFTLWLYSRLVCVVIENPGPAFVNVSTHSNFSFAGLNLKPAVNYLFWIFVLLIPLNFIGNFSIWIFAGHNPIEAFRRTFSLNFVSKWLTISHLLIFLNEFLLAFLRLNELPTSPLVKSLLIVHTCTGIVVLSYYMDILNMPKHRPDTPDVSLKGDNEGRKNVICSSAYKIIHLIFVVWFNLCVISFIMGTNPGPAFGDVGKHLGDFWEPDVYLMLWWFVCSLQFNALYHANICFNLFAGTNNQLIVFGRPVKTDHVLIRLQNCFTQVFGCGVLLLQLYEVPIPPHILYLLILHTISGFVYLCANRDANSRAECRL